MKTIITVCIILFYLTSPSALAWDSTGHRLIADIGYNHLTEETKEKVDNLTKILDKNYPAWQRFLYLSTVPDQLRAQNITQYNTWHYINYPWSSDGTPIQPPVHENVVWAIQKEEQTLRDPNANPTQKAIALQFLIHFVGDVHQPLHCINRFSKEFPQGDEGGNLFPVKANRVTNLHALWDQGVGLFKLKGQRYPLANKNVQYLAQQIEQKNPESTRVNQADNLDVEDWAQQCFNIAKSAVYQIQENTQPSASYIAQSQTIVAEQIALAGYRLANLLNNIFKSNRDVLHGEQKT